MEEIYLGATMDQWAEGIADRLSDEWIGNVRKNKEDVELLCKVLEDSLKLNPEGCKKLIGTSVIEENYFEQEK